MRLLRRLGMILLAEPMAPLAAAAVGLALVVATAGYCVVYVAASGGSEGLGHALGWAVASVLPWWAALEIGKRAIRARARFALLALLVGAALASLLLEYVFSPTAFDPAFELVRRVPALLVVTLLLGIGVLLARTTESSGSASSESELPSAAAIDWVRAAGNYVEARADGRTRLVRMTMQRAEEQLAAHGFLRVHRSTLVRIAAVADYLPGKEVDELRFACGTSFRIGESYRSRAAEALGRRAA